MKHFPFISLIKVICSLSKIICLPCLPHTVYNQYEKEASCNEKVKIMLKCFCNKNCVIIIFEMSFLNISMLQQTVVYENVHINTPEGLVSEIINKSQNWSSLDRLSNPGKIVSRLTNNFEFQCLKRDVHVIFQKW